MRARREECGVFGVVAPGEAAARRVVLGLLALQHRGQESAGVASMEEGRMHLQRGLGLVAEVFDREKIEALPGPLALGHVRYATTGAAVLANAQPLVVDSRWGPLAIAHNGNLVDVEALRRELAARGERMETTSDTELIVRAIAARPERELEEAIGAVMRRLVGAFSVGLLAGGRLYAFRDAHAIRPLEIGRLEGGGYAVASESSAFDHTGLRHVGEVRAGELCVMEGTELRRREVLKPVRLARCVFEYIYFARPDSVLAGRSVHETRERMGALLAEQAPVEADVVVPVPDSGVAAALGFARRSGIPFELGLVKSRYIGRSFILSDPGARAAAVRRKLNPVRSVVRGRRICLVDDSIVRGTTSARLIRLLFEAGARAVHLRISSPPIRWPCYYGVDTARRLELIASSKALEEIRTQLGADSLAYLSEQGLVRAIGLERGALCMACIDRRYPTALPARTPVAESEEGDRL